MQTALIAELLSPYLAASSPACHSESGQRPGEEPAILSPSQLQSISTYIDILLRWNARINLTAIRDPEQIVTRHFGESLFAARHLFLSHVGTAAPGCPAEQSSAAGAAEAGALTVGIDTEGAPEGGRAALQRRVQVEKENRASAPALADLGSGAGFPGIPIKLWAPDISLTLIESNQKKATFLREVARALTLTDINIQTARAETLPKSAFDVVTLRAVERFESILPKAASLVRPAGRLALLIGSAQQSQARSLLPNLSWSDPQPIPGSESRILLIANV
jgi:16S rRNA (guanine527-N7)-methyltransferase